MAEEVPSAPAPAGFIVEDRQPDGTWAPAVDHIINAETGEVVELPPPPPAARMYDVRQDAKGGDTRSDSTGGKTKRGKFRGWKAYKDAKEATEAEAAAVAFVNEGIVDASPLSEDDLTDSRASAKWIAEHPERKGLVEEGTLPHTGRPRFRSLHGFLESDERGFQGDRFSNTVPVDMDAYRKDPEAYRNTGRWAVIPSVYADDDGVTRLHTADAAEAFYRKSGKHFGIYEGLDNANFGAEWDHHKGNAEWAERGTHQDTLGGETGEGAADAGVPVSGGLAQYQGGPRIVINPQVFSDKRDALCVAFNEAFRVVMEMNGFEPASEPTEAQRKFFSDTAYADDELQLRRTILARIATFDTSVKDPTDEQLEETAEMLEMVMEVGAPQSEWEQAAVKRLHDVVVKSLESTRANGAQGARTAGLAGKNRQA